MSLSMLVAKASRCPMIKYEAVLPNSVPIGIRHPSAIFHPNRRGTKIPESWRDVLSETIGYIRNRHNDMATANKLAMLVHTIVNRGAGEYLKTYLESEDGLDVTLISILSTSSITEISMVCSSFAKMICGHVDLASNYTTHLTNGQVNASTNDISLAWSSHIMNMLSKERIRVITFPLLSSITQSLAKILAIDRLNQRIPRFFREITMACEEIRDQDVDLKSVVLLCHAFSLHWEVLRLATRETIPGCDAIRHQKLLHRFSRLALLDIQSETADNQNNKPKNPSILTIESVTILVNSLAHVGILAEEVLSYLVRNFLELTRSGEPSEIHCVPLLLNAIAKTHDPRGSHLFNGNYNLEPHRTFAEEVKPSTDVKGTSAPYLVLTDNVGAGSPLQVKRPIDILEYVNDLLRLIRTPIVYRRFTPANIMMVVHSLSRLKRRHLGVLQDMDNICSRDLLESFQARCIATTLLAFSKLNFGSQRLFSDFFAEISQRTFSEFDDKGVAQLFGATRRIVFQYQARSKQYHQRNKVSNHVFKYRENLCTPDSNHLLHCISVFVRYFTGCLAKNLSTSLSKNGLCLQESGPQMTDVGTHFRKFLMGVHPLTEIMLGIISIFSSGVVDYPESEVVIVISYILRELWWHSSHYTIQQTQFERPGLSSAASSFTPSNKRITKEETRHIRHTWTLVKISGDNFLDLVFGNLMDAKEVKDWLEAL